MGVGARKREASRFYPEAPVVRVFQRLLLSVCAHLRVLRVHMRVCACVSKRKRVREGGTGEGARAREKDTSINNVACSLVRMHRYITRRRSLPCVCVCLVCVSVGGGYNQRRMAFRVAVCVSVRNSSARRTETGAVGF